MIKVDLHVHSKMSKKLPFSLLHFQELVRQACSQGLSGFALTEHFHSYDFWDIVKEITRYYPYKKGQLTLPNNFTVLTGAEITVADGADIIAIGPLDEIANLDGKFQPRLSQDYHPYLADILDAAKGSSIIFIGAHPTRPMKKLAELDGKLLSALNALELNGRDVADGIANGNIKKLAAGLNLPTTSGSDAHLPPQVGVQYSLLPVYEFSLESLRYSLSSGLIQNSSRRGLRKIVEECVTRKKIEMERLFPGRVKSVNKQQNGDGVPIPGKILVPA